MKVEKPAPKMSAKYAGRLGGLVGGKARAEKLTSQERNEIARKAAEARWGKRDYLKSSQASPAETKAAIERYTLGFNASEARKRPRVLSIVFCDLINVTKEGKVNLIGVFDSIFVHSEKRVTPLFSLFVRAAEVTEEPSFVTIYKPDGIATSGLAFGSEQPKFTPGLPAQIQLIIGLQFEAEMEGTYWFDVSYKGESIGGAGLVVHYRETEDKQGGTDTYI